LIEQATKNPFCSETKNPFCSETKNLQTDLELNGSNNKKMDMQEMKLKGSNNKKKHGYSTRIAKHS